MGLWRTQAQENQFVFQALDPRHPAPDARPPDSEQTLVAAAERPGFGLLTRGASGRIQRFGSGFYRMKGIS